MGQVRWGILGAGRIARKFASDIAHAPSASLKAVGARDRDRAESFANEFAIPNAHGSYEALVEDAQVDAIYVATPHNFHLEHSVLAMRAGKAVLCEKPLTPSVEEAEVLIKVAVELDIYLMEAMWSWFLPSIQKAKDWVEDGRIGEVIQVRADLGFQAPFEPKGRLWDKALAGGALLDIGIYPIAFNRLMLGRGPDQIQSVMRLASTGVEDETYSIFQTGPVTSVLTSSFRSVLGNVGSIIGAKGRIDLPWFWCGGTTLLFEGAEQIDRFDDNRAGGGFEFEIEAASQDILNGRKQSETVPHSASLALQQDMDAVRRSVRVEP